MKPVTLPPTYRSRWLTGVAPCAAAAVVAQNLVTQPHNVAVFIGDKLRDLEALTSDLETLWPDFGPGRPLTIRILPDTSGLEDDDPRAFELRCDRLATLASLVDLARVEIRVSTADPAEKKQPLLLIAATPASLLLPTPHPESLDQQGIHLRCGQATNFQALQNKLACNLGYDCEAVCETPGQFAVRGGLLDVYPLNAASPVRIDFFGDEIESIRAFDPTTQRSGQALESVSIMPGLIENTQDAQQSRPSTLVDYLPSRTLWVLQEPTRLEESHHLHFSVPENIPAPHLTMQTLVSKRASGDDLWLACSELEQPCAFFDSCEPIAVETESLEGYRTLTEENKLGIVRQEAQMASRTRFLGQLKFWQKAGHQLCFVSRNEAELERLSQIVRDEMPSLLKASFRTGNLCEGFRLGPAHGAVAYVTSDDVFGRHRTRSHRPRRALPAHAAVDQALDFSELADGDHLVHLQSGVCIFRGLQTLQLDGKAEEVITLEFDEGVTIHLRLHESHLLSRYVGLSKIAPKLGRIGTSQWAKTRAAAERATLDFAAELLRLQAERETAPGHAFSSDHPWLAAFEDAFPHQETPDQLRAIQETRSDMERPHPMDRLICGDVGFGKTEVALRAAFQCVLDGRQVALLIPTTVLCQQHFRTFRERLADYPVVVEMLSRFRTSKQQREIKEQLKQGRIDIIVGTHSLLSRGVTFKDLGLLVIDEEHRFGVKQKEKIKQLRRNIDVIAMSATPIPRTLHSALVGVRQMSVIETPPQDRLPIQTVVKNYDPALVKDAITYELNRGGQVFYLHNRVQTIEAVASQIQELVPDSRLAVGHGQMEEGDLEKIMTDFVDGRYDILVCTTIIESGLDIPNCNTIIIEGADRFGLGQLYQLRGRVGRFNRQAYAYLLLHRHAKLLDLARKRLGAIRQYNQLGAGFRIAMRDLELRGAGNLLGPQQSGHIAAIGFDLYCQLLRQSVARLKGDQHAAAVRTTLRLDFVILGEATGDITPRMKGTGGHGYDAIKAAEKDLHNFPTIEAALPAHYIAEAKLRIDFYRKLAMASTLKDIREISETLEDRFGSPPVQVQALLLLTEIRILAQQAGFSHVETEGNRLKLQRSVSSSRPEYYQTGGRFPRLTLNKPLPRLREICKFLNHL